MEQEEVKTGTTIIAFKFKDGVIIAADSRTSSGQYVESHITDKLTQVTPNIYCCRSGSAADTQIIVRTVQKHIKLMSCKEGTKPAVHRTARLIQEIIYKNEGLVAGIIVAGYDTEPRVCNVKVCGTLIEKDIALGGSGSIFIYSFCDTNFRNDMSLEEGLAFARQAVGLAIKRDTSSGGCIRIAAITENAVKRYFVPGDKVFVQ
ncbi:20S proteasome subunit beta 1 [Pancytospora philotis]|nr:20S proteasome subunit beta 1 [Pancytospora philotis]